MRTRLFIGLVIAASICSAAAAGIAYAFSTSVLPGLDRVEPRAGIASMQGIIDEAASNVLFLLLLIGSGVLAVAVGLIAAVRPRSPGSICLLLGAVCTLAAGFVTLVFNVPLDKHLSSLAVAKLSVIDAGREWQDFADPWMVWNDVRCVSGLLGAALLAVGLWRRCRQSSVAGTRRGGGQPGGVNPPVSG
jgi:uncharacterized membrane protein